MDDVMPQKFDRSEPSSQPLPSQDKKSLFKRLKSLYLNHPIANLSFITGWRYPSLPRLKGNFLVGRFFNSLTDKGVLKNLLKAGKLAENNPSGMSYFWLGNKPVVIMTNANDLQQLFIEHEKDISRAETVRFLEYFWGSNITTDPDEIWDKKAPIYLEYFSNPTLLKKYEPWMKSNVDDIFKFINSHKNQPVPIRDLISRYSIKNILNVMVPGIEINNIDEFTSYTKLVRKRVHSLKNIFKWSLPTLLRKIFFYNDMKLDAKLKVKMRKDFDNLVLCPYQTKITSSQCFIHSIWNIRKNEKGQENFLENSDVYGESSAVYFASQYTSSSTFEFVLKQICKNPPVMSKLNDELNKYLLNQTFNIENINKIEYLDMVIKETMRLFPSTPMLPRSIANSFTIINAENESIVLTKGTLVIAPPLIIHRMKKFWDNPEKFDPERFSSENINKIPQYAYIPFGLGKHQCVATLYAIQQIKILVAGIFMNYIVEIKDNSDEFMLYGSNLLPKKETFASFKPKQNRDA